MSSPDRWLVEQRELVKKFKRELKKYPHVVTLGFSTLDVRRLCTLVTAMDNWLVGGTGLESLPEAWRPRVVGPRGRVKHFRGLDREITKVERSVKKR